MMPIDALEHCVRQAEEAMSASLNEQLLDAGPEDRVRKLRASVLGTPEEKPQMQGLDAALRERGGTKP